MELLWSLWIPIVVAPVVLWFYGALAWMALPHHRADFKKLSDDTKVMDFVRDLGIAPGTYGYPNFGSHADAKNPEFKAKCDRGPMGTLSVWTKPNMGKNMLLTFVVELIASALLAYLAVAAGVPQGAEFGKVMQVIGTGAILTYSVASLPNMIWFQANKAAIVSHLIDGVVMGLLTGAVFALLWPK